MNNLVELWVVEMQYIAFFLTIRYNLKLKTTL